MPMATRPLGPIQLLSNAYFRKKVTARINAVMPIRFSQRPPTIVSQSSVEVLDCEACSGGAAKILTWGGREESSRGLGVSARKMGGEVCGGDITGATGVGAGFGGVAIPASPDESVFSMALICRSRAKSLLSSLSTDSVRNCSANFSTRTKAEMARTGVAMTRRTARMPSNSMVEWTTRERRIRAQLQTASNRPCRH
jgi:hypothetical protein